MNVRSLISNLLVLPKSASFVFVVMLCSTSLKLDAQHVSASSFYYPPGLSVSSFYYPPGL